MSQPKTLLEAMTEDQWQNRVVAYARLLHILTWHDNDSRRNDEGFLDLVLVGPGGLVFAELKKESGSLSPGQHVWIDALKLAGVEVHVWRPSDWPQVQEVLLRISGRKRRPHGNDLAPRPPWGSS